MESNTDAEERGFDAFVEDVRVVVAEYCAAPTHNTNEFKVRHIKQGIDGTPGRIGSALRRLRDEGAVELVHRRNNGSTWRLADSAGEDGDRDE